jgi:hypothetical protein
VRAEERGQAHLPDLEMTNFDFAMLPDRYQPTSLELVWKLKVRKAGLPPLVALTIKLRN